MSDHDAIDRAAGLSEGDALWAARRLRPIVVQATQASHDALLHEPVEGLEPADRLRIAQACCEAAGTQDLALHYAQGLAALPVAHGPRLQAMLDWALALTRDPRRGDRASLDALKAAGVGDAAIVALAQLVAFLAYQIRVVAGLRAMREASAR